MCSERIEVIVVGGLLGQNSRVARSDQPASLTLERLEYK